MIVSLETAKLAKELGFNLNSPAYYGCDEPSSGESNRFMMKSWIKYEDLDSEDPQEGTLIYSAPTQEQLQKWLREVKKIRIFVKNSAAGEFTYDINVVNPVEEDKIGRPWERKYYFNSFRTYEEALEDGLKQSLKLLQ